jgi:hypothetical protein
MRLIAIFHKVLSDIIYFNLDWYPPLLIVHYYFYLTDSPKMYQYILAAMRGATSSWYKNHAQIIASMHHVYMQQCNGCLYFMNRMSRHIDFRWFFTSQFKWFLQMLAFDVLAGKICYDNLYSRCRPDEITSENWKDREWRTHGDEPATLVALARHSWNARWQPCHVRAITATPPKTVASAQIRQPGPTPWLSPRPPIR